METLGGRVEELTLVPRREGSSQGTGTGAKPSAKGKVRKVNFRNKKLTIKLPHKVTRQTVKA